MKNQKPKQLLSEILTSATNHLGEIHLDKIQTRIVRDWVLTLEKESAGFDKFLEQLKELGKRK